MENLLDGDAGLGRNWRLPSPQMDPNGLKPPLEQSMSEDVATQEGFGVM